MSVRVAAALALALALLTGAACAPRVAVPDNAVRGEPVITENTLRMPDGARLPLYRWLPRDGEPRAVILGVHGFGDTGMAFDIPASWFAANGFAVYAYDQRGFGANPNAGIWPGTDTLVGDLDTAVRLIDDRHPETPVYVLGASMGGAVVLTAAAQNELPAVDGAILAAPAVWARSTMPFYQRWALWLGARLVPWLKVSGTDLGIRASDNDAALYALGRDPHVIVETRVDALHGLTNLMDAALAAGDDAPTPLLSVYGVNDAIVPAQPMLKLWHKLPEHGATPALYRDGWHMLLRDVHAHRVWHDIEAWIAAGGANPLPSDADDAARRAIEAGRIPAAEE
ncbi:Lysophospholipase, alpha-beta hydrolase superfamily [Limimonas halophila]|uniref:Lysophospholipase, alpha-beta hydrolase superfamily n=1 Tax=Limimonas halophila TaxID=1082479 RepID=A0A1G7S7B6_9PROT|nr:alpha/beta fold hydrolase [Limimonas halophila]SDG18888.1 Lysophospholipase, alpha-beta hydrolase superfamily [Limimonas halophila]